ncbi:unnamed protein product [Camellia sinensis]
MKIMGRTGNASVSSSKPNVVNIGALYTFNSVIGRSAKPGIEAAVDDVNSNSTVLAGMKLNLILHDTNCSGFLGTVEALLLNIAESRMKTLKNQEEYVDTLHKGPKAGGVATIVDSFLTLSSYCTRPTANLDLWDKNLLKTDGDLDSPFVVDLSTAILRLLENGDLQRIHDRWILLNRCFAQANQVDENILYTPKDEEQDIDEHESIRPKSTLHVTSFKDFVDKKEDEVMDSIKQKSNSKRQASQCSDGHPSSPSS